MSTHITPTPTTTTTNPSSNTTPSTTVRETMMYTFWIIFLAGMILTFGAYTEITGKQLNLSGLITEVIVWVSLGMVSVIIIAIIASIRNAIRES